MNPHVPDSLPEGQLPWLVIDPSDRVASSVALRRDPALHRTPFRDPYNELAVPLVDAEPILHQVDPVTFRDRFILF